MKLFKVSRIVEGGYDTFSDFVAVAKDAENLMALWYS